MRAVLTREEGRNVATRSWLPGGWSVEEVPATATRYEDPALVEAAAAPGGPYRWVVVTSARAARYAAVAPGARVAAVGPASASALEALGVACAVVGDVGALALAGAIDEGPVLVLAARAGRRELVEALSERGLACGVVECYDTVPVALGPGERALLEAADVVVVGAPSAWAVVAGSVHPDAWVVVPGETTRAAVGQGHSRVVVAWGPGATGALARLAPRRDPGGGAQ
ncbi:MAG TPA: uroporphyrinogen-III synthase [Acidimicrobiales bacterium]|nr:uroporphyrinogen-III synthase [Acidimicrobiales bacterium]